jgi:hypothetical protein
MEVIKHKISLENSTDRTNNSSNWGNITATTFYINVLLTQNIYNMGIFTDISYIAKDSPPSSSVDYTILTNKLTSNSMVFPFMVGETPFSITDITETDNLTLRFVNRNETDYYYFGNSRLTGYTDSKIEEVKSYNATNIYIPGFNIGKETYINYDNVSVNGVNAVVQLGEPNVYAFDALADLTIGTPNQQYGLYYEDFSAKTRTVVIDETLQTLPTTKFNYIGEGRNETNISLSALTKEEYLFGIISTPQIKNDVFIDRGIESVLEKHLRLSEIKNLGQLNRYGNGIYKLRRE